MRIKEQLVSSRALTSGEGNQALFVTVHETANRRRGAGAQAHANGQSNGNARNASWHWQVDDHVAIRSFPDTVRCWHAGDGRGPGNLNSIGVEICVNVDSNYEQALSNAAELVRRIRAEHGIPATRVVQHNNWSGKNCPTILRSRGARAWQQFVASTEPAAGGSTSTPPETSTPPAGSVSDMATEVIAGKHGNGHENRRRSLDVSASVYEQVRAEVNRRAA